MFNEILTGKASVELTPVPENPYRTEAVPNVSLTCVDCGTRYQAPIGTPVGRCGACHVALVSRNQAASMAALHQSRAAIDARQRGHRWMRWALLAVVACTLGLIKRQMRKEMAASQPKPQRIYIYDSYVEAVHRFQVDMCSCPDAACKSRIRAQWMNWQRTAVVPSDSDVLDLARESEDAMFACLGATP